MIYSKVFFLEKVTGVYRELSESASHSRDFYKRTSFVNSAFSCRSYYARKYGYAELSKEVELAKIKNLLSLSFDSNKTLRVKIFRQLRQNNFYNPKIWLYAVLASCSIGRLLVRLERNMRK